MSQVQQASSPAPRPKKVKALVHKSGPLAKGARIRSDAVRHAYVGVRRLLTTPWHYGRVRAAAALAPNRFTVDRDRGFLLLPPGELPHVDAVVASSRDAFTQHFSQPGGPPPSNKPFLVNVLRQDAVTRDTPFLDMALHPELLSAISRYLGVVPLLTSVQVFHSDVMTKAPQSSQLFHCDGDDLEQIKIFVLCSEVTPAGGPLTLLPASDSARVRRATGYQYRQRLNDDQVEAAGGGTLTAVVGAPGTSVLVDTSRCFHFGSRVKKDAKPRLMTMIQYQTPYSFMLPLVARTVAPYRHLGTRDLSRLQRMVLGAE